MAYVADLHIHSRFAQACSQNLNIPSLAKWAKFKGIDLLGTGDFLHPLWRAEIKSVLKETGDGLYEYDGTKFLITTEVACIYSENGKGHRIHILIFLPSFDSAERLSEALMKKGAKLASDGRPIMGLSARALCDVVFSVEPDALIIPAHIWTPWFSLYGSNSGYDRLEDCFGEFSDQIFAVETGLSSEPAMNWRIKDLDHKSIVSFSDLHSLPRMGREVTLIGGTLSYKGLSNALQTQNIVGTIEFFPEEGKYHYSGHRNCNVVYSPEQLKKNGEICPVCKRKLTVGVMARVEDLASRSEEELEIYKENGIFKSKKFPERAGFRMLVQLEEIIAESLGVAVKTQSVQSMYEKLVTSVDPELKLLTKTQIELISMVAGERIAEGIQRVREGKLEIEPGFDNTYGKVKIWHEGSEPESQAGFF